MKETIEQVKLNPQKFRQLRGDQSKAEFAKRLGFSTDMVSKIERGDRWHASLERFAEFCETTGTEPNAFFEIVKKLS